MTEPRPRYVPVEGSRHRLNGDCDCGLAHRVVRMTDETVELTAVRETPEWVTTFNLTGHRDVDVEEDEWGRTVARHGVIVVTGGTQTKARPPIWRPPDPDRSPRTVDTVAWLYRDPDSIVVSKWVWSRDRDGWPDGRGWRTDEYRFSAPTSSEWASCFMRFGAAIAAGHATRDDAINALEAGAEISILSPIAVATRTRWAVPLEEPWKTY